MELEVKIQEKIQSLIDEGTVDKMIEDAAKKSLGKIVEEVFSQWGDFYKELKETVSEKLQINIKEIELPIYGQMVKSIVENELNTQLSETTKKKIISQVDSITGKPEKQQWKLSEIIEKYRDETNKYNDDNEQKDVVFDVEESGSHRWVRVGEKEEGSSYISSIYSSSNKQSYDMRMLLDVKTGEIHGVWYDNKTMDPRKGKTHSHTFEGFMMKLWANECVLEIDQDEAEYIATKSKYD